MKIKIEYILLTIILLAILTVRLGLAYTEQNPNYSAYFSMRQADSILTTGLPFYKDTMNGNSRLEFSPLYYYFLAAASLILGKINAIKIIPNLLMVFSVFLVYLISRKITKNNISSIIAAFFVGFTPIVLSGFINTSSSLVLSIPLFLLTIYYLLTINKNTNKAIILIILLILSGPLSFILILGLGFYILILKLEKIKLPEEYKDILLFSIPLILWYYAIIYRHALFIQGISVLWMNLPSTLLSNYFSEFNIITAIYSMGSLILIFAIYAIYHSLFIKKSKDIILISGISSALLLMLITQMIKLREGLLIFSFLIMILSAYSIKLMIVYIRKTRFSFLNYVIVSLIVLFFIASSFLPAIVSAQNSISDSPKAEDISSALWLKNNTDNKSIVLTTIHEADFINYKAKRGTVSNEIFLLRKNPDLIIDDINAIYTSRFLTPALERMQKYRVDYILYSRNAKTAYNNQDLPLGDNNCFKYINGTSIYKRMCSLEKNNG